jgi:hypothetical protein
MSLVLDLIAIKLRVQVGPIDADQRQPLGIR